MDFTVLLILAKVTPDNSNLTAVFIALFVAVMVFILIRKIKKILLAYYKNLKKENNDK